MELLDGGPELYDMSSGSDEHPKIEDGVGVGDVCELWNVFCDVSLYHHFAFLSDSEDFRFRWVQLKVAGMLNNEENAVCVSECKNEVVGCDAHIVAEGSDDATVRGDLISHVSNDGVNSKGKERHRERTALLYTRGEEEF